MGNRRGWRWTPDQNSGTGSGAMQLFVDSEASLYAFDQNGRLSTITGSGSTIEFPDAYSRGEAWELRFRTADTGNGQFQGIFLQVRTDVANSSTIRGMEIQARQGANTIAIGELIGITAAAYGAGTTGAITTMIGMDAQVQMDSDSSYTVTNLFGMRIKLQIEDAATITTGYGLKIELENVTGSPTRLTAIIGASSTTGEVFRYGIDTSGTELTNGSANEVILWKFLGANGTTYYMKHDTDAATVIAVVTSDPTS
ncbi:hypothetical protein LCGC14_1065030 [marine sediment metagenome]|uniref:Uncharacterized protein n=1 Tax=marine sediment metagenome TaxID=412755 RepID=A0A0F9QQS5_9ZZZZ